MKSQINYVKTPSVESVSLTLTPEEMYMLGAICGSVIGGGPFRNFYDNIYGLGKMVYAKNGNYEPFYEYFNKKIEGEIKIKG